MPTKIEWTQETWNPVTGCTPVSEGCDHCYAARMSKRLQAMGKAKYRNGFKVTTHPESLAEPLRWRKPRMVFACSMSDLFHEAVPFDFIAAVYGVAAACPQHTIQILTKRLGRAAEFYEWLDARASGGSQIARCWAYAIRYEVPDFDVWPGSRQWPLPNVWLGVTAENQQRADERIPILLQIPAAVRFVSIEPMLGAMQLDGWFEHFTHERSNTLHSKSGVGPWEYPWLDWVICGGESGPGARPMKPDWARSLRDQCKSAGVPFFMKQMAKKAPIPDDLMIREMPGQKAAGEGQ